HGPRTTRRGGSPGPALQPDVRSGGVRAELGDGLPARSDARAGRVADAGHEHRAVPVHRAAGPAAHGGLRRASGGWLPVRSTTSRVVAARWNGAATGSIRLVSRSFLSLAITVRTSSGWGVPPWSTNGEMRTSEATRAISTIAAP